ncbi:MAG: hypothetical protein K2H37_04600 [Lachnospiraceae bacterium]|nr:hypothetical protein [Lachnospiraceae bacterium]
MARQLIFCLETNKRANTDYIYIKEAIDFLYQKSRQVKISPIYMGTKTKYRSKDVLKEIGQKKKMFIHGETKVIYFIDTDAFEKSIEHANAFRDIRQFCEENNYDLVWFCHDVEEVFLGRQISDDLKVQAADTYRDKREIEKISSEKLSSETIQKNKSNLLCVLDKYLIRK